MRWALTTVVACIGCLPVAPPPLTLGATPPASSPSGVVAPAPLRRLTRAQYNQSVLDLFAEQGLPDAELTAAAADGRLDTADGIAEQTWRLLKEPAARQQLLSFHQQWLGLGGLLAIEKDSRRYPLFSPDMRVAMRDELEGFVDA